MLAVTLAALRWCFTRTVTCETRFFLVRLFLCKNNDRIAQSIININNIVHFANWQHIKSVQFSSVIFKVAITTMTSECVNGDLRSKYRDMISGRGMSSIGDVGRLSVTASLQRLRVTHFVSTIQIPWRSCHRPPRNAWRSGPPCDWCLLTVESAHKYKSKLECGPMPNVMAALPNIGGALCSTPQSLANAHYYSAVQ